MTYTLFRAKVWLAFHNAEQNIYRTLLAAHPKWRQVASWKCSSHVFPVFLIHEDNGNSIPIT
jgi:hypothetical protein